MSKLNFSDSVYRATSLIPKGQVSTYDAIAKAIGRPGASRAVGNALNRNPYAPQVPCHRVVRSDGRLGGFAHGPERKTEMLRREGVPIINGRVAASSCLTSLKKN